MSKNFYNKVAKKFGGYAFGNSEVDHISEYSTGDPEEIFKKKLLQLSDREKVVLDVGCGDGKFAFQIADHFFQITGIDNSTELLAIAKQKQLELDVKNVVFEEQDAHKTSLSDESFDLAFSRRGPTPFQEVFRLLRPQGYFVYITIGEKDCQEIKEVFGRGQSFGEWHNSRLQDDKGELEKVGFEIIFAQDFLYDEYYRSYESLDLFLQGVPIFEDFDSDADKKFLENYVSEFTSDQGVRLPRHRVVMVAKKLSA
jgi:ubiquinone/menaquinone biosynthesis C-methylase UbiE